MYQRRFEQFHMLPGCTYALKLRNLILLTEYCRMAGDCIPGFRNHTNTALTLEAVALLSNLHSLHFVYPVQQVA